MADVPKLIRDTNIIHRFSDVADEPCIMLPPIEGLIDTPLVSLETAVEPLVSFVYDIKTRVDITKKGATQPSDALTSDESASIALYTMEWKPYTASLYYVLNSTLRSDDREQLKPWFLYLKLLLTALYRLPSTRLTVYRSLKLCTEVEYERYQEGQELIWWGFSSCTLNKDIYQQKHFLNSTGTRTLFIIECLNGKYIGPHSFNKNDQEVLLLLATQFQVDRCDRRRDDLHKIYLKEIEPKCVLLEPVFLSRSNQTTPKSPSVNNERSKTNRSLRQFCQQSFDQIFKD